MNTSDVSTLPVSHPTTTKSTLKCYRFEKGLIVELTTDLLPGLSNGASGEVLGYTIMSDQSLGYFVDFSQTPSTDIYQRFRASRPVHYDHLQQVHTFQVVRS